MAATSTRPADFKPQIDSLRAFAVLAVWCYHLWFSRLHGLGDMGVRLFFVISGYLITRILMNGRATCAKDGWGAQFFMLRAFYIRRFLRLFPAYYLLLLILGLTAGLGDSLWWHLSYTSNFWFVHTGESTPWYTAHFWTLSIEEQFYLFWPLLLLLTPPRYLLGLALIMFAVGPVSRAWLFTAHYGEFITFFATPVAFDALGCGILLACIEHKIWARRAVFWIAAGAGLGLYLCYWLTMLAGGMEAGWILEVPAKMLKTVLLGAAVYYAAMDVTSGLAGKVLDWRPLRALGKISYGLYLYHVPCWLLVWQAQEWLHLPRTEFGPLLLLLVGLLTIAVSSLSWVALEAPMNRLKRFFPYTKKHKNNSKAIIANSNEPSSNGLSGNEFSGNEQGSY
ncbi:MAG: acyltransferase [Pseudomonadales bacterium]|jgi:peptidoglycan/LPS O-acetylase OafA/YrhL|nr:acyltransferase [Pseudomonadales bacterium]